MAGTDQQVTEHHKNKQPTSVLSLLQPNKCLESNLAVYRGCCGISNLSGKYPITAFTFGE